LGFGSDDHDGTGSNVVDSPLQLGQQRSKTGQTGVIGLDDDDTDRKLRDVLLILKALISRYQNVKGRRCAAQQVSIPEACQTFLLNSANKKLGQVAPELTRHVLVEQHAFHAI
jgi:hypothetical protein